VLEKPTKQAELYARVEALREKHPDWTTTALIEKAGGAYGMYYKAKREIAKRTKAAPAKRYKRKAKTHEVMAAAPRALGSIPVLLCTPEQIREIFQ
jgi:DNA-binding response OmpR family regulator